MDVALAELSAKGGKSNEIAERVGGSFLMFLLMIDEGLVFLHLHQKFKLGEKFPTTTTLLYFLQ